MEMLSMMFERDVLVQKLMANKAKHKEIFDDAMVGYRAALMAKAEEIITLVDKGELSDAHAAFYAAYQLPRPEDHTRDYDVILDMLEMTTDDTIELGEDDFRMYMRDEWAWKAKFVASTQMYNSQPF
jgi:hypothetical protein